MSKERKIKIITDVLQGRLPKSALRRGMFYERTGVSVNGELVTVQFRKDGQPIGKEEFEEVEADPMDAIIWRETKTY